MNRVGLWIAVIPFLGGMLLLYTFYLVGSAEIAFVGYFFIIGAGVVTLFVLLVLIVKSVKDKENRRRYLKTSGLILLNIPVVVIYFILFLIMLNTMRICFINETGKPITDIRIIGCEAKTIKKLDINERRTCWIAIPGDCSITIEYKVEDRIKREEVFSYVTNSMGQRATYRIGTQAKPIDETF